MAARNPFTPTFGAVPIYLAGRQRVLENMRQAFADRYGNPNLSTILIGARGTGKTALMSCIRDEALALAGLPRAPQLCSACSKTSTSRRP